MKYFEEVNNTCPHKNTAVMQTPGTETEIIEVEIYRNLRLELNVGLCFALCCYDV